MDRTADKINIGWAILRIWSPGFKVTHGFSKGLPSRFARDGELPEVLLTRRVRFARVLQFL
ncbi:hypothetical protein X767_04840 [Mesorhizobium sp. LSJC264A00]|nr:hypothetical protein X767_04840 [Mesorhizobium sp. LSJC264A00]